MAARTGGESQRGIIRRHESARYQQKRVCGMAKNAGSASWRKHESDGGSVSSAALGVASAAAGSSA